MRFNITRKLTLLIGILLAGLVACVAISYQTLSVLKVNGPIYKEIVRNKDLVADILPPPEYIIESYLTVHQLATETDTGAQGKLIEKLGSLKKDYVDRHAVWTADLPEGEIRTTLLENSYQPAMAFFDLCDKELVPAVQAHDEQKVATLVAGPLRQQYEAHRAAIDKVVELSNTETSDIERHSAQVYSSSMGWLWGTIGAALIGSVAAGLLIGRSIVRPLTRLAATLQAGANHVATAAGEVAGASQNLAKGASQQAASLEETSASLAEMSVMTRKTSETAIKANGVAAEANKATGEGEAAVSRMSTAIEGIQKSAEQTAQILKAIDGIAFQTNLLALNAAVEAARAGDAGRGFSVVAEEVRNLAMRSAEAARTTAALIEESVQNARSGAGIAIEVQQALGRITKSAKQVQSMVGEIAAGSQEQAQGITQVGQAVNSIDQVTQSTAAASEESASASEELSAQAENFKVATAELLQLIGVR